MGIKGIDKSFKIKPGKEEIKTKNYWGNIRIKKDRNGTEYIDVLLGKKDVTHATVLTGVPSPICCNLN